MLKQEEKHMLPAKCRTFLILSVIHLIVRQNFHDSETNNIVIKTSSKVQEVANVSVDLIQTEITFNKKPPEFSRPVGTHILCKSVEFQ